MEDSSELGVGHSLMRCADRRGMWRPRHTQYWRAPVSPPWSGWQAWTPSMQTGVSVPQVLAAVNGRTTALMIGFTTNLQAVAEGAWPALQWKQAAGLACLRHSCITCIGS